MTDLCMHMNFKAQCRITRLEDTGTFVVEVEVQCAECGEAFRFPKLPPAISTKTPCVNIDGTIATLPIEPEGQKRLSRKMTIEMPKIPETA